MRLLGLLVCFAVGLFSTSVHGTEPDFSPGLRVLLDAHNCYPYKGAWADRIDRALGSGTPLAIEIDLGWYTDSATAKSRLIVVHGKPFVGDEPGLREYFFDKIRPVVENALKEGNKTHWPLITLNINDIRGSEPELFRAVWDLMDEFESWLCTAVKQAAPDPPAPLDLKPVLVLTAGGLEETEFFYNQVPVGGRLRLFGSADTNKASNFRRWINHSWQDVEREGQPKAGDWTPEEAAILKAIVDDAHSRGYWVRFYTLDGLPFLTEPSQGWGPGYNFGSLEAVKTRWKAARDAGVDFIASDQYEELSAFLK